MPRLARVLGVLVAAAWMSVAHGAEGDDLLADARRAWNAGGPSLSVDWDNDAFIAGGHDGFYTNGTRLTLRYPSPVATEQDGSGGERHFRRHVYGWRVGQNMYTPSDIALPPDRLDPNDRPYAGYAFVGVFRETYWSDGNEGRYLRLGVDVGCIGPCSGAEHTQKTVHRWLGANTPQGWDQQIRNEMTVQFRGEYSPGRVPVGSWMDVAPYITGQFGNTFIHAGAGAMARFGRFNTPFAGSLTLAPTREGLSPSSRLTGQHSWELFVFARFETRAVAYNATLQGGWFNDSPRTVNPNPLVLETEWGIAWASRKWSIGYSYLTRTNEISGESYDFGHHRWGRIQVAWQFN